MKMEARSGLMIWIVTLTMFICTIITITMYDEFAGIGSYLSFLIIMAASTTMAASFILRNYLLVSEQTITICFGMTTTVLEMASIVSLKKVTSLIASASSAVKRIEIQYADGVIYVSPKDEEKFMEIVCQYNPKVKLY